MYEVSIKMLLETIDLFCGCGGLSSGLVDAGFHVIGGIDYDRDILDTYAQNFEHEAICHDLSQWEIAVDIIRSKFPHLHCIAGSPPCIEFSRAGNQIEGNIASLTVCFAKIIASIKPRLFIMENVPDVIMSSSFALASDIFSKAGYNFCNIIKDAKHCGVPQARRRAFVVGCATGAGCIESLHELLEKSKATKEMVSIRNALDLDGLDCPDFFFFPARNKFQASVISVNGQYPTLRSCNGICLNKRPDNVTRYIRRPNDASELENAHTLTIQQAACLSSFPPGYIWPVDRRKVGIMLGNCVPPRLAAFIGGIILETSFFVCSFIPTFEVGKWINPKKVKKLKMVSHIKLFEEKAQEKCLETLWMKRTVQPMNRSHTEALRPSTTDSAMELYYTMGAHTEVDAIAQEVMGFVMKAGWTFYIKERVCQRSRIDDMFVIVPGQPVPYRGKAMLYKNKLLP